MTDKYSSAERQHQNQELASADSHEHISVEAEDDGAQAQDDAPVQEARLWSGDGWTARVIKNDDDDGWAVAMMKDGQAEAALVGPWTMGRDKKNPKPLDAPAFHTLVKTANEYVRRHEQQLEATLHKKLKVMTESGQLTILLDIVPEDDDPYATLTALDEEGERLAKVNVPVSFKLTPATAAAWIEGGYRKVG